MRTKRWASVALWLILRGFVPEISGATDAVVRTNTSFVVDVWTTEHGLPRNEITTILQTRDGYLWLGTLSGLVRFDGIRFTVFDETNTPGLRSGRIVHLFEDSATNLWVGTANAGVALIQQGRVINPGIGQPGREGALAAACEDPSGAVWLYLTNGQLWRYKDGNSKFFLAGVDQPTDYRGLIAERSGSVWFGTDRQLSAIDWKAAAKASTLPIEQTIAPGRKLDYLLASRDGDYWRLAGRIEKWKVSGDRPELDFGWYPWGPTKSGPSNWGITRIGAACEDRDGNIIVGTLGSGVYWFNANGDPTHISVGQGLSNDYIFALHVDREGDLWVGTDGGGLNRVKRPRFEVLEPSRGLVVQTVAGDDQGRLWIGYKASLLTSWKDGVTRQLGLEVRSVYVDRQQRVWAGTWGAGLLEVQVQANKLNPVPGFDKTLQIVSAIHQDRRGWLWVGTQRGLARWDEREWKTLTTRDGLSADSILAIADDKDGNVWIGTEGAGLNRWHDGQITVYRKSADGLPSDDISAVYVDDSGVVWVGTDGGGLARFGEGKWRRYTRDDGLVSNSIGYIIEDGQGYLWLGSNAGLMRATKQDLLAFAQGATNLVPCRVYGRGDGLPIRECSSGTQPGPWRGPDGKLWFPTIKGLVSVDPAELKPNTNPPPVRIEAVLINGQLQHATTLGSGPLAPLVVPAGKQHIEIQYTGLNLAAPERARFKYRLQGHESEWIEASGTRVSYPRLAPAHYQFQVIACNEDGVWNMTGATLAFTVQPPIWRTWWFLSLSTALLLGSVAAVVHYLSTQRLQRQLLQLRQQEALEKERSRIARDIHDQLGASLTQVALLGELVEGDKDEPAEVQSHARQISQTARDTTRVLDEIVWAVNPANDTLDGLMTYVCKYSQEYLSVAGLHYRLDVPGQLPATPLPPDVRHNVFLACKEAVTNIVRHARASAVWVRLRLEPKAFVLEIEDNGRGLAEFDPKAAQSRNGLRNMQKRMEEIGGAFSFAPAPEGGTLVRFSVPMNDEKGRGG